MGKKRLILVSLLLSVLAGLLQGPRLAGTRANSCTESLTTGKLEGADANSVDAILTQLKKKTAELVSYQVQVEYRFKQPLLESQTLRKGVLYYQKLDGKSMLRVNFQTLKQDDEEERKCAEHFIFDSIWLTQIIYEIKTVKRHQLAEPNKPVDAFDLAGRNLPIIGFTQTTDLKKQCEVTLVQSENDKLVPSAAEGAENAFHLHLKVNPDSIYKDDYTTIDFWIDKKLFLPAKVVAVSTEEDIYQITFLQPKVNEKIDKKIFEFDIPKDFTIEVIPLEQKEAGKPDLS
jgi:outer membrane lipoprotein-sorting protein